jgi:hypothetical protein
LKDELLLRFATEGFRCDIFTITTRKRIQSPGATTGVALCCTRRA